MADDFTPQVGDIVTANIGNPTERGEPDAYTTKYRPAVVAAIHGDRHYLAGLTTLDRFADGGQRVPFPRSDESGSHLWGGQIVPVKRAYINKFIGRCSPKQAELVIKVHARDLAPDDIDTLRRTAR